MKIIAGVIKVKGIYFIFSIEIIVYFNSSII